MNSLLKNIFRINNTIGYKALLIFNVGFMILLFLCTIYIGLAPTQNKFGLFKSPLPILAESGALIALLIFLVNIKIKQKYLIKHSSLFITLFFILIFILQLIIAGALQSYGYTWDSQQMFTQASKYALYGKIDVNYMNYMRNYPNNIALLSGLGELFKIFHSFGINDFLTLAVYLNVCLMWATQIITYHVIKILAGTRIAVISLLFGFVLICLSMYVPIPYTDTLTIIFPIFILYLSLQIIRKKSILLKSICSALIGVTTIIGTLLKPTVLIAFLAIVIVAALWFFCTKKSETSKAVLKVTTICISTFLLTIGLTYVIYTKAVDSMKILPYSVEKSQTASIPPLYFAAMGLKTNHYNNSVNYGGYDAILSSKVMSLSTENEKNDFSIKTIKAELQAYGIYGYLDFIVHKANWILSDSTFFAWGEGSNANVTFVNNNGISKFVRNYMYVNGNNYILLGDTLQIFWLAILILISSQFFIIIMYKKSQSDLYATMLRLMIAGILIFLLLFEGRSRYIFLYVPIFITAAAYTLKWLKDDKDTTE